jgi:hypothetical protein
MANSKTHDNITDIEDAANARWLVGKLTPARVRCQDVPTLEAVDRMRATIFGEEAARRKEHSIAA